ncbi:MAG: PepSY-associated TM helix domain-containing protein [Planctomycetota bacterium]
MKRRRTLYQRSAAAFRWLHLYLSMLGFAALMFFALTGITLNHPTWLGGSDQVIKDHSGQLDISLLKDNVNQLEVAETLRQRHGLQGRVKEFEIDDFECMLVFKSPGYAADVFVDRSSGQYDLTVTSSNIIAVLNELHKGRDSGSLWKWIVIDGSAILLALFSISGFGLLFYLRKRRVPGLWTALAGTIALLIAWIAWVP